MDSTESNSYTPIVFDFDGTIAHLFKNYSLKSTVKLLQEKLKFFNIHFSLEQDAFEVFKVIELQTQKDFDKRLKAFLAVERILSDAELQAVETCELVDGVTEIIPKLMNQKYKIGIASNNSEESIKRFLERHLPNTTIPIIGRVKGKPYLMKPDPWSLNEMSSVLDCPVNKIIFVGDTYSDYLTSLNASCEFIAMATNESKKERLKSTASEHMTVSDFYEFEDLLVKKRLNY